MSIKAETRQQNNVEEVDSVELNAWRRGFTPQAEIWNGRLAMLGFVIGLSTELLTGQGILTQLGLG